MAILPKKTNSELILKFAETLNISEQHRKGFVNRVMTIFENSGAFFNREDFKIWADTVYDPNPLHQDEEYATSLKGFNFKTTPVFGTLISSKGELLTNKIANEINLINTKKVLYSGSKIKYGAPLYPGEALIWALGNVSSVQDDDNILGFNIVFEGKKDGKIIVTNTAKFRYNRNIPNEEEIGKILSKEDSDVIAEYDFEINHEKFVNYNKCIGNRSSKIPMMFPGALVPAGLLKLCYDKTKKHEGVYGGLDLEFYARAKLGNFKVVLKNNSEPRNRRGTFTYNFKGIVLQEGNPILSGDFKCLSQNDIIA